jgi:hypothetical protein
VKHNPDLLEDDYEDSGKYTPLIMAAKWKRTPMVKALLEAGANVAAIYKASGYPGERQTVLESWISEPSLRRLDDAMHILEPETLGRHMHDTLRLLLDAGLDPTTPVYYRRRDEFGRCIYPEETVLMVLAQPAPIDDWFEFPDSDCSVFIGVILSSILSRDAGVDCTRSRCICPTVCIDSSVSTTDIETQSELTHVAVSPCRTVRQRNSADTM